MSLLSGFYARGSLEGCQGKGSRAFNPAREFREDFLEEVMAVLSLKRQKDIDEKRRWEKDSGRQRTEGGARVMAEPKSWLTVWP